MFFKKDKNENNDLSKVAALLIHAAKIDENFSKSEEVIIKQALLQIGVKDENLEKIFLDGKKIEENSNQILEFTKEVKSMNENNKMKIDKSTVERLAKLSKLEFSEQEKMEMVEDFKKMVGFVDKLKEVDTEGVEPLIYINEDVTNVMREDKVEGMLSVEDALKNAPEKDSSYIKVPKVLKKN